MENLENEILLHLSQSQSRVTFRDLQRRFLESKPRTLKKVVARLVRSGRLAYTYEFGDSYLVVAFDRPIAVSDNVILAPPNTTCEAAPDQAVVVLERGGAFGLGDHPTTRLAIRLLDALLLSNPWQAGLASRTAMDIGTGSGVLAIVAATLGVGTVLALDTDPCAVFEARSNVRINQLEDRIVVSQNTQNCWDESFDLILANLRTPTLLALRPQIEEKAAAACGLIFSGIQLDEADQIRKSYAHSGFVPVKMCSEKNWCAISFVRGEIRGADAGREVTY